MSFRTVALFACGAIVGLVVGTIKDRQTITTLRADLTQCTAHRQVAQRDIDAQTACLASLAQMRHDAGASEYTNADCAIPETSAVHPISPIVPNDCVQELMQLFHTSYPWTWRCLSDSARYQLTCTMEHTP